MFLRFLVMFHDLFIILGRIFMTRSGNRFPKQRLPSLKMYIFSSGILFRTVILPQLTLQYRSFPSHVQLQYERPITLKQRDILSFLRTDSENLDIVLQNP